MISQMSIGLRSFETANMNTARLLILIYLTTFFSLANADESLDAIAQQQLIAFTEAVLSGPDELAPFLAPEFQVMRSNGIGYDREEYLQSGIGTLSRDSDYSHEDIRATQHDNVMVVQYKLKIGLSVNGKPLEKLAPRLSVFRKVDNIWKVVAHSNFAVEQ